MAQFCGFIDEHAEALEVHDHWGTWSFGSGIEAHLSPSQLPEMGHTQCSRNQLAAEERNGCGMSLRTPQVKAPKMPLQRTDPRSHTMSELLWAQPGHVTLSGTWCPFLPNSHEGFCADHDSLSGIPELWRYVYHKGISCFPQNTGKSLGNIKLLLHVSKEFMVF